MFCTKSNMQKIIQTEKSPGIGKLYKYTIISFTKQFQANENCS